jgi:hypothetical protein
VATLQRLLIQSRRRVEAAAERSAESVAVDPAAPLPDLLSALYRTSGPTQPAGSIPPRVVAAACWLLLGLGGGFWWLAAIFLAVGTVATSFIARRLLRRVVTAVLALPLLAAPLWVLLLLSGGMC